VASDDSSLPAPAPAASAPGEPGAAAAPGGAEEGASLPTVPAAVAAATGHDASLPVLVPGEVAAARAYAEASRAATRRAYDGDWRRFAAWCRERDAPALPASPALVAVYLSALATVGKAPPSVARALAAIAHFHRRAGFVAPHRADGGAVVADVLAGIRRSRDAPPDRKAAVDADVVMRLLWSIQGDGLAAVRDRALLAFGMALAARRSELVALDVEDLEWERPRGVRVTIRRSKTDQEGEGQVVAVPEGRRLRPLVHLRAWLAASGIERGPLFRPLWKGGRRVRGDARLSDHAVARIVQARAAAAGLDPARYAGHSLRAGFVTAAARAGADIWKIREVSRHKSLQVLGAYIRDARLFEGHAGDEFL
jgi:site-specific recombinase XerD